jgi:ESCRT-II complex subunit VPS25
VHARLTTDVDIIEPDTCIKTYLHKSIMTTTNAGTLVGAASTTFSFPRDYHFPPFFTRQPQRTTFHAQCQKWSSLIQAYCRAHRIWKLSLVDALDTDLFYNKRLGKRLSMADAREVVEFMRVEGRAEWIGKPGSGEEGGTAWIWWRTPEEWAIAIAEWVSWCLN